MKTYLDCIPCFFRQALEGSRVIRATPKQQKQIIDEFSRKIPEFSLRTSPPEIARFGYSILRKIAKGKDPYGEIKQKSNRAALRLLGRLRNKIKLSRDRLLTALELAIAGNIIDFGAKNNLNIKVELKKILALEERFIHRKSIFHYAEFRQALKNSNNILYLADNAGETVFDRILIEEIKRIYPAKDIYYAVKAKPIINDALFEDAKFCGVDKVARIISNGTGAPGTILSLCSKEFKKIYRGSDMIISKGQGNFESLSGEARPIFFLFTVKCQPAARESGAKIGSIVLIYNFKK
ncbi:MAG: ARMT1-like domain-containing protein [Candidatus Omnitrophota bacterium]